MLECLALSGRLNHFRSYLSCCEKSKYENAHETRKLILSRVACAQSSFSQTFHPHQPKKLITCSFSVVGAQYRRLLFIIKFFSWIRSSDIAKFRTCGSLVALSCSYMTHRHFLVQFSLAHRLRNVVSGIQKWPRYKRKDFLSTSLTVSQSCHFSFQL